MVYELAHIIKKKCSFLWQAVEWINAELFCLKYHKQLENIDEIIGHSAPSPFVMKPIREEDIVELEVFFKRQPKEAFRFFNPHGFDKKSIKQIVNNQSFIALALIERDTPSDKIVGYAFMRCFVNGTSYRGYMVDASHSGKGLAKIMGGGLNQIGDALGLKMYKSISPKNIASMKATQSVCDIKILKTLENGDFLIRCMSKTSTKSNRNVGGGKLLDSK